MQSNHTNAGKDLPMGQESPWASLVPSELCLGKKTMRHIPNIILAVALHLV